MTSPIDDQDSVRLSLQVRTGCSPITGTVFGPDGARQDFSGWTALASVIERCLAGSGTADDQPSLVADGG